MRAPSDLSSDEVRSLVDGYLSQFTGSTQSSYAGDIRKLDAWRSRRGLPNSLALKAADAERYLADLRNEGWSVSYIRRLVGRIPSFYKFAYRNGISVDMTVADVAIPTIARKTGAGRSLSDSEVSRLIHFADLDECPSAVVRLLALYGLGPGELGSLRVGDLEMGPSAHLSVGAGDSRRRITLDARTSEVLAALREGRRSGPLILNQGGRAMSTQNIGSLLKRVATQSGMQTSVTASQLRATMIALAIERGFPIYDIARSVGLLRLEKIEQYLPPDDQSRADVGLLVADTLAPDPAEAILDFVRDRLATRDFPAAGLCALIGLLVEGQIRAAMQRAKASVRGQEALTTMMAALVEKRPQYGSASPYVEQLRGIRNLAAHGHLHEVTYDHVTVALELRETIARVLESW